ncbi:hypothetical protein DM02DRAFT_610548 [Periconia macrospinosa]|uniref:Bet v1-like protein n=1 Tax=Periconia macrospinosa TaxID=97972 RepID=A0A2V1E621_9PLEO|nr:hypothetical protein DM02DRAFT_610548 [Periconia macrospinosa]
MVELHPIQDPSTADWSRPITYADYNKLLKGFMPQDMDDRWVCVADTPDAEGKAVVHVARSWTGNEQMSFTIEAGNPNETERNDWGKITSITWRSEEPGEGQIPKEKAQERAVNFCRHLMGCKMENA